MADIMQSAYEAAAQCISPRALQPPLGPQTGAGGFFCEGLDVHSEITRDDNYNHDHANEVENIHFILLSAHT